MRGLKHIEHRPYPLPIKAPRWRQKWLNLAFFHWPAPIRILKDLLPDGLQLDLYEGKAWLSVVPFRMEDVMLRGLPALPGISHFPELNVRTYVIKDGKPGVWFFSLDADQRLAVWAARAFFHLPYHKAKMSCVKDNEKFIYSSIRESDGSHFKGQYAPVGDIYYADPGSLEYWLTERYCLYAHDGSTLYRGDIHHEPWPLQPIQHDIYDIKLSPHQECLLDSSPLAAQYAGVLDVAIWPLVPCA